MTDNISEDDFKVRRNKKNWVVLTLILGFVALIWGTTLLKLQALPKDAPVQTNVEKIEEQK